MKLLNFSSQDVKATGDELNHQTTRNQFLISTHVKDKKTFIAFSNMQRKCGFVETFNRSNGTMNYFY